MLLEATFCGFWAVILVPFSCEFGQRLSEAFGEIEKVLVQLNWYLLPIEVQRMLPTIIIFSQKPLYVRFFGSISCHREQFQKVSAPVTTGCRYQVHSKSTVNKYSCNFRWWMPATNALWYFVHFMYKVIQFFSTEICNSHAREYCNI